MLGNCISILAEKSSGKAQKSVVPYRDSNLTRILQNALGGNAKTIMICAISPAALNYEETLSTLRYADRAKKIVNKAIINESVQDKMIRELKQQNDKLKMMILQAAKSGNPLNLAELGLDADLTGNEMEQFLEQQEKKIEDMEKPWEEKLKE